MNRAYRRGQGPASCRPRNGASDPGWFVAKERRTLSIGGRNGASRADWQAAKGHVCDGAKPSGRPVPGTSRSRPFELGSLAGSGAEGALQRESQSVQVPLVPTLLGRAVDEFCAKHGLTLHLTDDKFRSWLVRKEA